MQRHDLICLDELGDARPGFQAALLRLIEYHEYRKVGSHKVERANVQFIASTNRPVGSAYRGTGDSDGIRLDLLHRFHRVDIPPLAYHPQDIPLLVERFGRGRIKHVAVRFARWAALHTWPGNVRELMRYCEEGGIKGVLDIPELPAQCEGGDPLYRSLNRLGHHAGSKDTVPLQKFRTVFQADPTKMKEDWLDQELRGRFHAAQRQATLEGKEIARQLGKIARHLEISGQPSSPFFLRRRGHGSRVNNPRLADLEKGYQKAGNWTALGKRWGEDPRQLSREFKAIGGDPKDLEPRRRRRSRRR